MKYILLLFMAFPVFAEQKSIETDKIQLLFDRENLRLWVHQSRYGEKLQIKTTNRTLTVTIKTEIKNITHLLISDLRIKQCEYPKYMRSQLFYIHFKQSFFSGDITTKIQEPCIAGGLDSKDPYIKLKVMIKTSNDEIYYSVFTFTD